MATMVTCARCGQVGEGLDRPPLAGRLGQLVQAQVCRACWQEWVAESLMVINHYGLQPANPEHRQYLYAYLREFLHLRDDA